jgi:hypothetical protein
MQGTAKAEGRTARRRWQMVFCVLVAFLILYNPFIALYCSHGVYSVHTPQRNRATVGASELQHFGPIQEEIQQADISVEENRDEVAAPAGSFAARGFEREEEVRQPEFSPKIWSRPPPAL